MKQIKYNNKDFGQFRDLLINHAKYYFPNTYKDFNESSPGMMFIEMASVVGDVLSFYNDKQLMESFINLAKEKKNILNLAQGYGYKPNLKTPSQVDIEVYQLVPAQYVNNEYIPNLEYALHIKDGMILSTPNGIKFRTIESVNFGYNDKYNPVKTSIFETLNDGTITWFLLSKKVRAVAGEIFTKTYTFTDPKIFDKIVIDDNEVAEIISIIEKDGDDYFDEWYEVPFLAQDFVITPILNNETNNPDLSIYKESAPYLLIYKRVDKRYVTRLRSDDKWEIQFGSGLNIEADEEVLPNPFNVGLGIDYFKRVTDVSIDPQNFINTHTYGTAPSNVTLEIKYTKSNGLEDNVKADEINVIENIEFYDMPAYLNSVTLDLIKFDNDKGIKLTNPDPAYGGLNNKPLDIIKQEAMATFAAQNRAVTKEDYILRCLSMPTEFGSIAKAYIDNDQQVTNWGGYVNNQNALNLYIIGYNNLNEFVNCNPAIKDNLRRYLQMYRLLTDAINIKNAYIVNIGVNYDIIPKPNYNSYEVLLRCTSALKEYFHQTKMEINSPIIMSKVYTLLDDVEGVQTISNIEIYNKVGFGYSLNEYDIKSATREGIVYPSADPCIFEIKYPDKDIQGRIVEI